MALHHMLRAAAQQQAGGASDPYFEYNTLLLTGDGTNGAQNNTFLAANGAAQGPFADPAGYWSVGFDGSGDYLTTPSNAAFAYGTGDFTIEGWFYFNGVASQQNFIDARNGSVSTAPIIYVTATGNINYSAGGAALITGTSALTANTWVHIALSRSSSNSKLFVNGTQVGSTASDSTNFGTTSVTIGAVYNGTNPFAGYASNVRIVKGTAVYTSNFTVPTSPLTAISGTSLLTCQSNVICDTSSNLFAITANGNAAVNNKSPLTISSTYNPYSFSGYFDGSGDYLSAPNNAAFAFGTGNFTIDGWCYFNSVQSNAIVDTRLSASSSTGFYFGTDAGKWQVWYQTNLWTVSVDAPINSWTHFALVRNGSTTTLYVNGVSVNTSTTVVNWTDTNCRIGSSIDNNQQLLGYLSNLRVVKGTAVYTTNFTPPNEPLTAVSGTSLLTCQSSTFVDNSPNNFTITVNGNTTVATATYNPAMPITRNGNTTQGTFSPYGNLWSNYFDGSGDYLTPATTSTSLSSSWTMECWFYATATGSIVFDCRPDGTNGLYPLVDVRTSTQLTFVYNAEEYVLNIASGVLNKWIHLAVVKNGSNVSVYVNGISVYSVSNSSTWAVGASRPRIGANGGFFGAAPAYFTGYISNFRIVDGTAVYTSNFTPSTTPLTAVSGTSLLTCQSNRFKDNSSNNFTLTVNGNTSVQRFSPFNPTAPYSAATIGGSGYFDGTGDSLSFPTSSAFTLGTNDFTIEGWLYPNALANTNAAFALESSAYPRVLWIHDAGSFRVYASTTGSSWQINQTVTPIVGAYNHVVFQRNGNDFRTFLNGVVVATTTSSLNFGAQRSAGYIGRGDSSSQQWNGYIGDMRITNGTAVYSTSGFTPPTAPLTAITNTSLLCNFTNAGIPDAAMMNDLETVGNAQVSTSVKKYGTGSLYFDGAGDYLTMPASVNLDMGSGDFTIEGWVYANSFANYRALISLANNISNGYSAVRMRVNSSGNLELYMSNDGSNWAASGTTSSGISVTTWAHIAIVKYGSGSNNVKVYINGTSVLSLTHTGTLYAGGGYYVGTVFSSSAAGEYFNGYIDDLRITKGLARYTANFTPPTAALPTY